MRDSVCQFCGREFVPARRGTKYCSAKCSKSAWVARRSEGRAKRHRTATRICSRCGNPFEWDSSHSNRRFCSDACKRAAEISRRSAGGCRADVVKVDCSGGLPHELDGLRGTGSDEYFKVLFSLPPESQFAEMESWGFAEYEAVNAYFGALGGEDRAEIPTEAVVPDSPPAAYDEEDHFCE